MTDPQPDPQQHDQELMEEPPTSSERGFVTDEVAENLRQEPAVPDDVVVIEDEG